MEAIKHPKARMDTWNAAIRMLGVMLLSSSTLQPVRPATNTSLAVAECGVATTITVDEEKVICGGLSIKIDTPSQDGTGYYVNVRVVDEFGDLVAPGPCRLTTAGEKKTGMTVEIPGLQGVALHIFLKGGNGSTATLVVTKKRLSTYCPTGFGPP